MAKNVLQKYWDGTKYVEIHPVTKSTNVFNSEGKSIQAQFDEHKNDNTSHITSTERNTWNAKETPSGAQAKADTAESNAKSYTDQEVGAVADDLLSHKNDNTPHREAVSIERKNPDDDGIFKLIEFRHPDGTLFKTSQLNGTSPYNSRTVKYYDKNENLIQTVEYSITYSNDEVVSEVIISA